MLEKGVLHQVKIVRPEDGRAALSSPPRASRVPLALQNPPVSLERRTTLGSCKSAGPEVLGLVNLGIFLKEVLVTISLGAAGGAVRLRLMAAVPVRAEAVPPCHVHPAAAKFRAAFCPGGAALIARPHLCGLGKPKSGVIQGVRVGVAEGMGAVGGSGKAARPLQAAHGGDGEGGGCASRHFTPD